MLNWLRRALGLRSPSADLASLSQKFGEDFATGFAEGVTIAESDPLDMNDTASVERFLARHASLVERARPIAAMAFPFVDDEEDPLTKSPSRH